MMHWLLKHDGYPCSVAAAVALHGALLWFILERGAEVKPQVQIEQPVIVATTVKANPQRLRRMEQEENRRTQQRQQAQREREREAERKRETSALPRQQKRKKLPPRTNVSKLRVKKSASAGKKKRV
jgi:hypothetical protein